MNTGISPRIFNGVRIVNRPDPDNVWRLNRGALPLICEMEQNGMRVDSAHLSRLKVRLNSEMETLAAKVTELTGKSINLGSPDQLSELLFQHLRLKQNGREKWTKSKTRLAADQDVLRAMVSQHDCIKPIIDWTERRTLRNRYTDSLILQADSNSRIHTDLSTTTAETNRLASSDPNLQNIPTRTELGREIRKAFVAKQGNKIGSVDASQIEMRTNAVDSQCANLLTCFWTWDDVYWKMAEVVEDREFPTDMRKSEDKLYGPDHNLTAKKWFRQNAKVWSLMIGYDASPMGVFDQLLVAGIPGWTEDKVAAVLTRYFKQNPELLIRKKEHMRRAYKYECVWDMWGFVRQIPQVRSALPRIVSEGARQAGNLAGQGGAAGVIKLWMAKVYERLNNYWRRHGILILMQIHDELLAEGPENPLKDFLQECADILRNLLTHCYDWFNCPLDAGWGIADNWGEADH